MCLHVYIDAILSSFYHTNVRLKRRLLKVLGLFFVIENVKTWMEFFLLRSSSIQAMGKEFFSLTIVGSVPGISLLQSDTFNTTYNKQYYYLAL